ncbi:hypothetical protein ACI7RC_26045 [Brevibacillus sp. B_LB10_24]|uniref:hypothetical protein n=1 Tax=Brevibacillus sp. B_LB10_24 TaxID=3380645 RepID=UPI0038B757DA
MHTHMIFEYNTNKCSCLGDKMVEELILEWLCWRTAEEYMRSDWNLVHQMMGGLKLGPAHFYIFQHFAREIKAMEQAVGKRLRQNDIRILAEQKDRGEHFVVWKHRGETKMFRIHQSKLQTEVQKRWSELTEKVLTQSETLRGDVQEGLFQKLLQVNLDCFV